MLDQRSVGKSIRSVIHAKLHHSLHRSNDSLKKYVYVTFFHSKMGFDGLFFARLDYQDEDQRNKTKTMELIWKGSANLGEF